MSDTQWPDLADLGDMLWEQLTDRLFAELPGDKPRQTQVLRSLGTSCNLLAEAHERELSAARLDEILSRKIGDTVVAGIAARKRRGIDCSADESAIVMRFFDGHDPEVDAEGEKIAELFPLERDQWGDEKERGLR